MLRALYLGVLVSVVSLQAQVSPRSLGIFLKFDIPPAPDALRVMKDEFASILEPAGLSVYWRLLDENRGDEQFSEILVFRFLGSCGLQTFAPPSHLEEITLAT